MKNREYIFFKHEGGDECTKRGLPTATTFKRIYPGGTIPIRRAKWGIGQTIIITSERRGEGSSERV